MKQQNMTHASSFFKRNRYSMLDKQSSLKSAERSTSKLEQPHTHLNIDKLNASTVSNDIAET